MNQYVKIGLWIAGVSLALFLIGKLLAVIAVMQGIELARQIVELVKMIVQ